MLVTRQLSTMLVSHFAESWMGTSMESGKKNQISFLGQANHASNRFLICWYASTKSCFDHDFPVFILRMCRGDTVLGVRIFTVSVAYYGAVYWRPFESGATQYAGPAVVGEQRYSRYIVRLLWIHVCDGHGDDFGRCHAGTWTHVAIHALPALLDHIRVLRASILRMESIWMALQAWGLRLCRLGSSTYRFWLFRSCLGRHAGPKNRSPQRVSPPQNAALSTSQSLSRWSGYHLDLVWVVCIQW